MKIQIIFNEIIKYQNYTKLFTDITKWCISCLKLNVKILDIIFTTDQYLYDLHRKFFNLDTKTDVITFNLNESKDTIEGEIYISVDMAEQNSKKYNVSVESELCRLIIHGCLHLAGYEDKNEKDFRVMKNQEDKMVNSAENLFIKDLHVGET